MTTLDDALAEARALALKLDDLRAQRAYINEQIAFLSARSVELRRKSASITNRSTELLTRTNRAAPSDLPEAAQ